MTYNRRSYRDETDYWRIRSFLREVFLLNGRLEHSWHVARLDYWRWHLVMNCQVCGPLEEVITLWETQDGQIVAVFHPLSDDEIRVHLHPRFRTPALEEAVYRYAVEHHDNWARPGQDIFYAPALSDDTLRQNILAHVGLERRPGWNHHWRRDLDASIPNLPVPLGYEIRSMGPLSEHPARSWASWRAFHADEPAENYDGDYSWFRNIQSAPLYRRDLDIVATAPQGEIAAFCTIFYDDYTRSAVCVLVGTAAEHWRRGLGKAVMFEGMRRLQVLGCTRVFATASDEPADALYGAVMQEMMVTDTWVKHFKGG